MVSITSLSLSPGLSFVVSSVRRRGQVSGTWVPQASGSALADGLLNVTRVCLLACNALLVGSLSLSPEFVVIFSGSLWSQKYTTSVDQEAHTHAHVLS